MSKKKQLTMLEAVDNLSSLAELDEKAASKDKASKENWLDPAKAEANRETVKQSLSAVHEYLKEIYQKDTSGVKDEEMQKGVQAIMTLVGEAGQNLDKYTKIFQGAQDHSVKDLQEYRQLHNFYMTKILKKFQKTLEQEQEWQEEWGSVDDKILDIHQRGLKDLETVKRDRDYELFFLKKENGNPFFNPNLIRHIKLVGDLDEMLIDVEGDDPFLKIKLAEDKDLHVSAKEILKEAAPHIDDFYKEAMHHKHVPFVANINKSIMALMMASNPKNLMGNASGKSSVFYYKDFQVYLREAIESEDYQRLLAAPYEKTEKFFHAVINLTHHLCSFFFTRVGSRRESIDLIHRLAQKGRGQEKPKIAIESYLSFWNNLLQEDDNIRDLLKKYPNGPLFKTLDAIREQAVHKGFDPIGEQNLPSQMYLLTHKDLHVSALRLPSPTKQKLINEAEVVGEFKGFLRSFNEGVAPKKHLLINLQDRTSWQEHARCHALEELQKRSEFKDNVVVVTIAKGTEFYYQTGSYLNLNQADNFKKQLFEQVESGPQCGFYFPSSLSHKEMLKFSENSIDTIHEVLFQKKKQLSRTERLDFIEIFYSLLFLKVILDINPDTLSFTSKDSVDTGAASSAMFFCFIKLLTEKEPWDAEGKDFLLWMLYSSALTVRERPMEVQDLHRLVSAISFFHSKLEENKKKSLESFGSLFVKKLFDSLQVKEAS